MSWWISFLPPWSSGEHCPWVTQSSSSLLHSVQGWHLSCRLCSWGYLCKLSQGFVKLPVHFLVLESQCLVSFRAHTSQCPLSRGGIVSVLSCLPFIGYKQHFPWEGLSFLGKERSLKKAPHLIPVGQRLSWGCWQPHCYPVGQEELKANYVLGLYEWIGLGI